MAARYSTTHATPAGSNLTMLLVATAGVAVRAWVYDIIIASPAAPASLAGQFDVIRGTVSGTGSHATGTGIALDPADSSSRLVDGGTFSVAPTKTSNSAMLSIGLHQRQTYRWVGRRGRELVIPATADNWVGVECIAHGGTPSVSTTMSWEE